MRGESHLLLDTLQSKKMLLFKFDWRQSFIKVVASLWIVEHLDVVEDVLPGFAPRCIDLALNTLSFPAPFEAISAVEIAGIGKNQLDYIDLILRHRRIFRIAVHTLHRYKQLPQYQYCHYPGRLLQFL